MLDAVTTEGREVSDKPHAGNFAPRLFAKRPDRERFTQKDFAGAMERLFATRKIRREPYQNSSRKVHDKLVHIPEGVAQ